MLRRLYRIVFLDSLEALERPRPEAAPSPRSPGFKAAVALVATALMLTLLNFVALSSELQVAAADGLRSFAEGLEPGPARDLLLRAAPLYRHAAWTAGCVAFYLLIPALIVRHLFREPLSSYGLTTRGFASHLPVYLLLVVPVLIAVLAVSGSPSFQATYPFYRNPAGWADLLAWEMLYGTQFLALEFFFRGFLLHATRDRLGALAVPAMVIPYVMIHFTKPFPEALGAIVAGTVLGVLSLRTGTILGGVLVHVMVAVSMDVASLARRGWMPGWGG